MAVAKDQIRQIITENNITSVADVYSLLKDSFKDILQELLEAEMDATLGYEKNCKGDLKSDNKRNGHSPKTLKSQYGEFQIDVPRDRNGEFEPKLIPKYQRDISGIEEKVISLYARGMSTRDIHDQLQELYGIELSAEMVSKITDKILPEVKEWQSRPLNPVYPFVFMDCIHYKVREDGRILSRAAYIVLGVTVEGYKDILSITVGANETSKFWLGMLNDLKNRGVQDVLFFCVDGLPGFKDAIQAVFPQAQIQRCVIHMLRNSFKYVNYNDLKKFSADFKAVYNAPNESAALSELETIKEKWGKKYPYAISNWENNWEDVSSFFQFSGDIRRIMYTTNIIEGLNRQYRKVTKTRACQEHYQNHVDSFIIVSSDSDYWGLISSLPEARFLVMVEREKCSHAMKQALAESGIFYCYIDDFYSGNADGIKMSALFKEMYRYLDHSIHLNVNDMFAEALRITRLTMTEAEKRQFYDKYIRPMHLVIDSEGNVSIELKR